MDVFNTDPFKLVNMVSAFENQEYVPQFLKQFFTVKPSTTRNISIEEKSGVLSLIPFSERGTATEDGEPDDRNMRYFDTVRLAKGNTINASEIANIRAFGTESELKQVLGEVSERAEGLKNDIEVTFEYLRLGALQGKFMNPKDGTVKYNWFTEFSVSQPSEVNFALGTASTDVIGLIRAERRRIIKESGGAVTPQTRVVALCGDNFWDALITHDAVRETYLNWAAAEGLRNAESSLFEVFTVGGVDFTNYRGTDDSKVAVNTDKVIMFPTNVRDNLVHAAAPADEYFDFVNTKGRETYTLLEQDPSNNKKWARPEVKAYPLVYVSRPKTLGRGKKS